jgi:hypothetical protein
VRRDYILLEINLLCSHKPHLQVVFHTGAHRMDNSSHKEKTGAERKVIEKGSVVAGECM